MIKKLWISIAVTILSACSYFPDMHSMFDTQDTSVLTEVDYADYAKNVTVAAQGENYVIYEYKNIRVDDLAVLAALYCHDHNSTRAYLDNITLYHNNARRAKFICR